MIRRTLAGAIVWAAVSTSCRIYAAESVYVIAKGGHVRRIDNGFVSGPSLTNASLSFTRLGVGNETASGGVQVAVGDAVGGVHVYNGQLAHIGFTDVNGGATDPVTAVAVGSIGDVQHAIAATHLFYDTGAVALANLRGNALIFNSTNPGALSLVGSPITANPGAPSIFFPNGTPNTYVDAAIGDLESSAPGNELILGHHQLNADGSRVASAAEQAGKVREVQSAGGVNMVKRDHTMNNFLTGVALGDIRPTGGLDDVLQFGADNGAPLRTNRNSWQGFSRAPGAGGFPNFNFENFSAANQASAIVDAVIGEVLAGAFGTSPNDPAAPDLRNEVVSVGKELNSGAAGAVRTGNGVIEISNTYSGGCCLQQIVVTGEELTSVVVADILGSDGVQEIIVGGSLGNVHVFRHSTPGDLTSQFATTPFMTLNVGGGVLELAKYAGGFIPEPTSGLMVFVGVVGLLAVNRRRA